MSKLMAVSAACLVTTLLAGASQAATPVGVAAIGSESSLPATTQRSS